MKSEGLDKLDPLKVTAAVAFVSGSVRDARSHGAQNHGEMAMALMLLAAHELVHDGADVDDAAEMAKAAFAKSQRDHRGGCS